MSVARKILWNTLSQIAGKIIIAIFGIVIVKMLTMYLGKAGYGQYTTAYEFLAFFGIVADLGLYTVGVREMAKDEKKTEMIVGNILTVRTALSVIMVIIATIAAYFMPKYQGTFIPFGVFITGLAMIANILTSTVTTVLQVRLKMEYNSLASVFGKIATVGYMAAIIYFIYPGGPGLSGNGFYHLLWAGVIGNGIMLWSTFHYSNKYARIRYRFTKSFYKDVLLKALPYGLALVLNTVYFRIGSVLLSIIKGPEDVGIYGVPMRMLEAVGIIPLYFMNAVFPVLTRSLDSKDGKHPKIIQYAFDFLVMGSLPIVAGTIVLAYPIVYLVSTPEFMSNLSIGFYGSDMALQILIVALAFSFINSLFGFILVAVNQQVKLLTRNAVGAILTLILDLILIPYFGVRGAAFSNVVTEFYIALASYLIARHFVSFKISLKNTFKITLSALVMALTLYLLRDFSYKFLQNKSIFILLPIGAAVYMAMLFLTRTITKEMIDMIRKPKTVAGAAIEPDESL